MILITGAGGHLGANLIRRLLTDGLPLRAMLHTEKDRPSVEGLPVDVVVGDLRDAPFATASVRGCRQIYHCAAKVSTNYRDEGDIFGANVLGTRNILSAARAEGVEKVVVTGSFSAVGIRRDRPSNEEDPFNPLESHLPYGFTKAAVEHECLKAYAEGLPVVVAVSTAIVGPYDFKPSRMGQVLIRFATGRLRAYVPGGFPFVAASDIVQGHILAMQKGRPG
jgi:nucleoside-diphosphate-sugar epimerase